ncbi:Mpo1-like protein [Ramlibacter sp. AN1015]|uniref:Mpo1 family 2-hydroxy fatty acid dioxygenase n=1 Tax=Ramlibacter sp. AN1015 TaxID=3133428 RepID=UPI0030C3BD9B
MKTLEDQLVQYAAYHRDRRNIATHFVGIPLIMLGIAVLLSRPTLQFAGLSASPLLAVVAAAAVFYVLLDLRLGLLMAAFLALITWIGAWAASLSTAAWLTLGTGSFVVGWVFQFVGHAWEGRKPAFVDDLAGLLIGPLFVAAEILFLLGLRDELRVAIELRAGPTRGGRPGAATGA